jgi:hypothetical protein
VLTSTAKDPVLIFFSAYAHILRRPHLLQYLSVLPQKKLLPHDSFVIIASCLVMFIIESLFLHLRPSSSPCHVSLKLLSSAPRPHFFSTCYMLTYTPHSS